MTIDSKLQTDQFDEINRKKAVFEINVVITQLGQFGGNDSEVPEARRLLEQLEKKEITPEEAVFKANQILSSKMGMGMDDMYR